MAAERPALEPDPDRSAEQRPSEGGRDRHREEHGYGCASNPERGDQGEVAEDQHHGPGAGRDEGAAGSADGREGHPLEQESDRDELRDEEECQRRGGLGEVRAVEEVEGVRPRAGSPRPRPGPRGGGRRSRPAPGRRRPRRARRPSLQPAILGAQRGPERHGREDREGREAGAGSGRAPHRGPKETADQDRVRVRADDRHASVIRNDQSANGASEAR